MCCIVLQSCKSNPRPRDRTSRTSCTCSPSLSRRTQSHLGGSHTQPLHTAVCGGELLTLPGTELCLGGKCKISLGATKVKKKCQTHQQKSGSCGRIQPVRTSKVLGHTMIPIMLWVLVVLAVPSITTLLPWSRCGKPTPCRPQVCVAYICPSVNSGRARNIDSEADLEILRYQGIEISISAHLPLFDAATTAWYKKRRFTENIAYKLALLSERVLQTCPAKVDWRASLSNANLPSPLPMSIPITPLSAVVLMPCLNYQLAILHPRLQVDTA